jgi:hypothetical protein
MSTSPNAEASAPPRAASKGGAAVVPREPRDQSESPFTKILEGLVARVVGAEAAALVDAEGETVDYAGEGPPNEIRIAAAHWGIILRELRAQRSWATLAWFLIQTDRTSFLVQALPDGYALVVRLPVELVFFRFDRALAVATLAMAHEAGWSFERTSVWRPVDVILDASGRPAALTLGGVGQSVELLGRCADAFEGVGVLQERAWRVRIAFGAEAMLVCEPSGFWYADEPLEELAARDARPSRPPRQLRHTLFKQRV